MDKNKDPSLLTHNYLISLTNHLFSADPNLYHLQIASYIMAEDAIARAKAIAAKLSGASRMILCRSIVLRMFVFVSSIWFSCSSFVNTSLHFAPFPF